MYQTVTIRIAASSQQASAFRTMCTLVGRVSAIDEMPRHRAGAARAIVRPRRLHDDTPVKTVSPARLEPAHACALAPRFRVGRRCAPGPARSSDRGSQRSQRPASGRRVALPPTRRTLVCELPVKDVFLTSSSGPC
jgi:hypothetical protein